jgi:UDPglucose 6-dehydrogenase
MNISIIGIGKLGLCFGLNLSKMGHNVTGIDVNKEYIQSLQNKTFKSTEPDVNEYLSKYNINYSTNIKDAIKNQVIFVVVPTPSTKDFKYDHSIIDKICNKLIDQGVQSERKELIINCTTFPGYCRTLQDKLEPYNYKVSYNPEFIAQGTIIRDQVYCDNVLIGAADSASDTIIRMIYESFVKSTPVYNTMTVTEAELTKLSVNCFLTTKISFANMVGDIANRLDCNGDVVLSAVGTDSRIGSKYIKPGFGFGGPCFPRDNRALSKCGEEVGVDAEISNATDRMNEKHLQYQIEDFIKNNPDKTKPLIFDYVTYKKESVLLEESQQLKFALALKDLGYKIVISDQRPEVISQLKDML